MCGCVRFTVEHDDDRCGLRGLRSVVSGARRTQYSELCVRKRLTRMLPRRGYRRENTVHAARTVLGGGMVGARRAPGPGRRRGLS